MKIEYSQAILQQVSEKYNPKLWIVLFSGGNDSLCTLNVCQELLPKIDHVIFCDTGTCIPETKEFVIETCKKMNLDLLIGHTTEKDSYENYVLRFGFPGQNHKQHTVMYRMLKDHSLSRLISSLRKKRKNYPIALLTGAREDESIRRMGTSIEIDPRGSTIWVNPIQKWTKMDIHNFFKNRNIESCITARELGRSGECNCGVFGSPQELDEIRTFSPSFYEKMKQLEEKVKAKGFSWGWGESPPKDWLSITEGQLCLEGMQPDYYGQQMFLCSTCMNNNAYKMTAPKENALEQFRLLKEVAGEKDALVIGEMIGLYHKLLPQEVRFAAIKKIVEQNAK